MTTAELRDNRLGNVPEVVYVRANYDDVTETFFSKQMTEFEKVLGKVRNWPVRFTQIRGMHFIYGSLKVSQGQLSFCLDEIKAKRVITPIRVEIRKKGQGFIDTYYDPDDLRAVGSYVVAKRALSGEGDFRRVSPEQTVACAKRALGQNPVAAHLNWPAPFVGR